MYSLSHIPNWPFQNFILHLLCHLLTLSWWNEQHRSYQTRAYFLTPKPTSFLAFPLILRSLNFFLLNCLSASILPSQWASRSSKKLTALIPHFLSCPHIQFIRMDHWLSLQNTFCICLAFSPFSFLPPQLKMSFAWTIITASQLSDYFSFSSASLIVQSDFLKA